MFFALSYRQDNFDRLPKKIVTTNEKIHGSGFSNNINIDLTEKKHELLKRSFLIFGEIHTRRCRGYLTIIIRISRT